MTIVPKKKSDSRSTNKTNVLKQEEHHQDEHPNQDHCHSPHQCSSTRAVEDDYSGYNSGDEHTHDRQPPYMQWTEQEFQEKEIQFEKKINKKGWVIRKMAEDGACLFRAVADQIYGDQDMHGVLRKLCIDYIAKNSDYFSQYVTEDFGEYLKRKSLDDSHGNHIEIQAMSEMFNRPIEVYHYSSEPINIFQGVKSDNEPLRLSYHRSVHYNSIIDPFKATVGVGLGLPAYDAGLADRTIIEKAIRISNEDAIEKAMLEDKLLATDWEATNAAIEQQVARESYLEWLRENENRLHKKKFKKSSSPQPTSTAKAACFMQQQQEPSSYYPPSNSSAELIAGCSTSSGFRPTGGPIKRSSDCLKYPSISHSEAGTSSSSLKRFDNSNHRLSSSPPIIGSASSAPKIATTLSDTNRRSPRAGGSRDIS